MSFEYIEVWVSGTMPLLMSKFSVEAEANLPGGSGSGTRKTTTSGVKLTPREQAEKLCYRENEKPNAPLILPGPAFQRLIREAGSNHKDKGSRKSLKYKVPTAVLVLDEMVPLYDESRRERLTNYEVFSVSVVNAFTKGRVMCHRPRLEKWTARFRVRINQDLMDPKLIRQLLKEGGEQIGVGAFRPEKGGTFGLFDIVAWDCMDGRTSKAA